MTLLIFPDVNLWLALNHRIHGHHAAAVRWFGDLDEETVFAFCRQTQMALLRLLTNPAAMGEDVFTQRQAWALYHQWTEPGKAVLLDEPPGLDESFYRRTQADTPSTKVWADAYLAAFAEAGGLTLVTFDRALAGRAKGSLLLA